MLLSEDRWAISLYLGQSELVRDLRKLLWFHISIEYGVGEGFGLSRYLYLVALFWHLAKILLVSISSKP